MEADKEEEIQITKNQKWMKEMKTLHEKCGHAPFRKLKEMIKNNSVQGVSEELKKESVLKMIVEKMKEGVCEGCMSGKMNRLPVTGTIEHNAEQTMDLWVADLMGPVSKKTFSGKKYVLVIMDVYSHKMFVVLLNRKKETMNEIVKIVKREQTQKEKKVKVFHSDGGGEFVNNTLKQFFEENGTIHTITTSYTPEHNAIVERANRSICEMTRTIMHHGKVYVKLWGAAVLTASYLLNRTPCSWTGTRTPEEVNNNKIPMVNKLHVFGCDAYYINRKENREYKFDTTSKKGIFIGYDDNNESYYNIFDVDTKQTVKTRDVKFNDSAFSEMERLRQEMKTRADDSDNSDDSEYSEIEDEQKRKQDAGKRKRININNYLNDIDKLTEQQLREMFTRYPAQHQQQQHNDKNERLNTQRDDRDERVNENKNKNENVNENESENNNTAQRDENDRESSARVNKSENENENTIESENENEKQNESERRNVAQEKAKKQHAPTRKSTRVTSQPYRLDPNDYAQLALEEPLTYMEAIKTYVG
jgi:hypothetical protein